VTPTDGQADLDVCSQWEPMQAEAAMDGTRSCGLQHVSREDRAKVYSHSLISFRPG
jgi:hypothetical protein